MGRKLGLIGIFLLFVAIAGAAYLYLKELQSPTTSPLTAIPKDVAMVLEVKKPTAFFSAQTQSNELVVALKQIQEFEQFTKKLGVIDSIIKNQPKLSEGIATKTLYISWHKVDNQYHPLFVLQIGNRFDAAKIMKTIEVELLKFGQINTARKVQLKWNKFIPAADTTNAFYFTYNRGLLLVSPSESLLASSIEQTQKPDGIQSNAALMKLIQTAGTQVDAHLFVQFNPFIELVSGLFKPGFFNNLGFQKFAEWAVFDINPNGRTMLLNGFADNVDNEGSLARLFEGQQSISQTFVKYVPSDAESFIGLGISNLSLFRQNLSQYLLNTNQPDSTLLNESNIQRAFGPNAIDELESLFMNECAQIRTPNGNSLFMWRTKGNRDASELLSRFFNHCSETNSIPLTELQTECKVDNDLTYNIYKMPVLNLPATFFGPWFQSSTAKYASIFNDYIVFSNDYESLKTYLYNNVLQRTLQFDAQFIQFSDFLTSKSNLYLFISFTGKGTLLSSHLSDNAAKFYQNEKSILRNFYGFGWQFSVEDKWLYNNYLFRYQPTNKVKAATEWETRLDTLVAFKPVLVTNHTNLQKEVFVQDCNNAIYLVNHAGRVIWKQVMTEPIMGEIYQVDYYKNGKLQYLFNTKTMLHLIDRNGNYVEKYPIKLKSEASASLSLFDYDNRKEYRIFVPTTSNQVYVYNIEGALVTGFDFVGTDHDIIQPIEFIRDNNKDYLLVADVSRIYLLDRKGADRVTLSQQFEPSVNNRFVYQKGNHSRPGRLVRTDKNGTIYYIYFDGKVEQKSIKAFSPNHFFDCQDITLDGSPDFIFIDQNKLTVYNLSGDLCFEHTFSTNIKHQPAIYRFSTNNTLLGVTESDAQKIYLFNKDGKIIEGFPLPGITRFSIGILQPGSSSFNLIVGGDEQYLYNYKLN